MTVLVDRKSPDVTASVRRARLSWRATDNATPWIVLRVILRRAGVTKTLELGRRPLPGSVRLSLPRGRWEATLAAFDSSGNRRRVALGQVPAPG